MTAAVIKMMMMMMNMIWQQARGLMDRGMLGSVLDCTIAYPDRWKIAKPDSDVTNIAD